jgi:hypothetical protein
VYVTPGANAHRRGTLASGATVLTHARARGAGCSGEWLLIGPAAWVCNDSRNLLAGAPGSAPAPGVTNHYEFGRITAQGSIAYRSLAQAEAQLPDAEVQPGFFVRILEQRNVAGESYVRTSHGIWLARRDVIPVQPSAFEGVELDESVTSLDIPPPSATTSRPNGAHAALRAPGTPAAPSEAMGATSEQTAQLPGALPVGWTYVDGAVPRRSMQGPADGRTHLLRHTRVQVLEVRRHRDQRLWFRTDQGWLSERELRVPRLTPAPEGIGQRERWLDVDRRNQTLVAYLGETPLFATLVSTGRGIDVGPSATPAGLYRIWVKLTASDMDNLDELTRSAVTEPQEPYGVEAVPFVMFFHNGVGLHATYWHDGFGMPKSHGCVNLSLRDAERLFDFTGPKVPPGWQAAHPYDYDSGTLVRVR